MTFWDKLQYASIGLVDLAREWVEGLIAKGQSSDIVATEEKPARPAASEPIDQASARGTIRRRPGRPAGTGARTRKGPRPRLAKPATSRDEQKAHLLSCLKEGKPMTLGEMTRRIGRPPQGFARAVRQLVEEGAVRRRADGTYALKRQPAPKAPSVKKTPKKVAPKEAAPKKATPKKATPKKAAPKKATTKKAAPKKATPEKTIGTKAASKTEKPKTARKTPAKAPEKIIKPPSLEDTPA